MRGKKAIVIKSVPNTTCICATTKNGRIVEKQ